MEFLRKIRNVIQDLEEKDFYKYLGIILGVLVLVISFMVYRYYSKVNSYQSEIEEINETREGDVREVLGKLKSIEKQKEAADAILKEDEGFLILYYYNKLLEDLGLSQYDTGKDSVIQDEPSEGYRRTKLTARLGGGGMSMKKLCQLLEKLEQTKRISIKSLEIKKSKKQSKAIDVELTISTLLLKAEETT